MCNYTYNKLIGDNGLNFDSIHENITALLPLILAGFERVRQRIQRVLVSSAMFMFSVQVVRHHCQTTEYVVNICGVARMQIVSSCVAHHPSAHETRYTTSL